MAQDLATWVMRHGVVGAGVLGFSGRGVGAPSGRWRGVEGGHSDNPRAC